MATLPIPGSDLALLAVSSDLINTSGRIVYRHDPSMRPLDLKFNLGEIEVVGVRWGFPSVIDMEPGFIYNNVAIAHDLTKTAQGRSLFLISLSNDDPELYVKKFDTDKHCWSPLTRIVNGQGHAIKTHKLSHLAAAQAGPPAKLQLQLYFIDENSDLVELVGTSANTGYTWAVSGRVAENISPESSLAVICRDMTTTYVHYQTATGVRSVATRTGKDWTTSPVDSQKYAIGIPLGISITGERSPMCYFAEGDKIYAQSVSEFIPSPFPVSVGSHIPRTNIGAISFPGGIGPDDASNTAHVISMSSLDDTPVMLERVHRSHIWPETNPKWEIPAGVLDTPPTR